MLWLFEILRRIGKVSYHLANQLLSNECMMCFTYLSWDITLETTHTFSTEQLTLDDTLQHKETLVHILNRKARDIHQGSVALVKALWTNLPRKPHGRQRIQWSATIVGCLLTYQYAHRFYSYLHLLSLWEVSLGTNFILSWVELWDFLGC